MTTRDPQPPHMYGTTSAAPSTVRLMRIASWVDWKRSICLAAGVVLFCAVYLWPSFADAVDPRGESFPLTREGRAALALFALAATWWIFEVIPIGTTSIAIGVLQVLLLVRPAKAALGDFLDPSIWFIFASITIGMALARSGLTNRLAYGILVLIGERTSMVYLGTLAITAGLTLVMAHTAVAATIYPLLMSIYALYAEDDQPTKFGKGLFIGMAFVAGAASTITLLGSARAAVALGFFQRMVGREVSFFAIPYYMLPLGGTMVLLVWGLLLICFKPEKSTIPGLRRRATMLYEKLGPMTLREVLCVVIVLFVVALMSLQCLIPALQPLDKSAIILVATILFFVFRILTIKELEDIPWNIMLLFGGAMSIGCCWWETGAARWLAIHGLTLFQHVPWLVFVLCGAFLVLVVSNFMVNVAAIAILLPVALVMAPYLGVAPEVVLFSTLATAGMPFLLLIGSAPNAIAYESKQFSPRTFFLAGLPASILLMALLAIFAWLIWPWMGMPVVAR
jgi:solute carrier family 13 (sodium-dependent dicarboxylate transporter), member 2/3/5